MRVGRAAARAHGCRLGAFATLLGVVVLGAGVAAGADEPSAEDCLACHGDEGVTTEAGRPVAVIDPKDFSASAHGDMSCATCHDDATDLPHEKPPARVGLGPCSTCHADEVDEFHASVHGMPKGANLPDRATCRDCHGDVHTVRPHDDPKSLAHRSRIAQQCARCHADRALVERFGIPVVRPVEAYSQSAHARAVAAGKHGAVCSDCHGAHAIRRSDDPLSSISRAKVSTTCGTCHADVFAAYRDSVHGIAAARGVGEAPICTDCHGEHRILGPSEPTSPVFTANVAGETCGRCHRDARLGEKYGIPVANVEAFEDSFHGLALRGGKLTVANCASCHGVHDIRPSSDPRSHVHPTNLAETCGKCHPGAGTNLQLGPVHAATTSVGGGVAWVRFLYLWLIGVTIGGMVAHNVVDLARKATTPLAPPAPLPVVPERLPRALRWQHGLVMLSFPVLVYTGFALTYPASWWAVPLVHWETKLGLRGLLHRTAAVVLVVALAWHAVHIAVSARLRACLRGALPSRRDVRLFGEMLAYWSGRRPNPPHVGTWHYAEKAEYWAFLWGSVLMVVTGCLLWFENLTLRWLPSWVADVATAIHFYEAVLATLAILVWHLYWVVFDPAVYPMDWAWWSGQSPPHRVHERLPGTGEPTDGNETDGEDR